MDSADEAAERRRKEDLHRARSTPTPRASYADSPRFMRGAQERGGKFYGLRGRKPRSVGPASRALYAHSARLLRRLPALYARGPGTWR